MLVVCPNLTCKIAHSYTSYEVVGEKEKHSFFPAQQKVHPIPCLCATLYAKKKILKKKKIYIFTLKAHKIQERKCCSEIDVAAGLSVAGKKYQVWLESFPVPSV